MYLAIPLAGRRTTRSTRMPTRARAGASQSWRYTQRCIPGSAGIVAFTIFLALQLAVEKKGWWTMTWEFMSNGMHRPSSYSISWLLLTAIICAGLRVAWVAHRKLAKP